MSANIDKVFLRFPEFSGDDFPARCSKFTKFLSTRGGLKVPNEDKFTNDAGFCNLIKYIEMTKQKRIDHYLNKCDELFDKIKKHLLGYENSTDPVILHLKNMVMTEKTLISSIAGSFTKMSAVVDFLQTACDTKIKSCEQKDVENAVFEISNIFINFRKFLDIIISPSDDKLFIRKDDDQEFMEVFKEPYENMLNRANAKKKEKNMNAYFTILAEDIPVEFQGRQILGNKCVREHEIVSSGDFIARIFDEHLSKYIDPLMRVNRETRNQLAPLFIEFFCNFVYAVFIDRCFVRVKGFSNYSAINVFLGTFSPMKQLLYDLPGVNAENLIIVLDDQEFGKLFPN